MSNTVRESRGISFLELSGNWEPMILHTALTTHITVLIYLIRINIHMQCSNKLLYTNKVLHAVKQTNITNMPDIDNTEHTHAMFIKNNKINF